MTQTAKKKKRSAISGEALSYSVCHYGAFQFDLAWIDISFRVLDSQFSVTSFY